MEAEANRKQKVAAECVLQQPKLWARERHQRAGEEAAQQAQLAASASAASGEPTAVAPAASMPKMEPVMLPNHLGVLTKQYLLSLKSLISDSNLKLASASTRSKLLQEEQGRRVFNYHKKIQLEANFLESSALSPQNRAPAIFRKIGDMNAASSI